jgi:zinc protease
MAVIAVGDFDVRAVEALIREHFSRIPRAATPRARPRFPVPDHDSALVTVATDPEATSSGVSVYFKQPERDHTTVGAYRQMLVERLFLRMLNERFFELAQSPDAPFLGASASQGSFVGPKEAYVMGAGVREGGIVRGLEALLTEAERVRRHGFTGTELEREKQDVLRGLERAYAERDKTESAAHADELVAHVVEREPVPGIAREWELAQRFVPTIAVQEVNRLAREWITDRSRVIAASAPEKAGLEPPTAARLLAVFDSVRGREVAAYADSASTAPLVARAPAPGRIVSASTDTALGVTRWTLSNDVDVVLRPTDFRADQVLVRAFSPGGTSLLPDSSYIAARSATSVVFWSGLGALSRVELQKALAGKAASVSPLIGDLEEGVSGQASPKDLETLFQLIWLTFTAPREDSAAVAAFKARQRASIENRSASPEAAFVDTLVAVFTQHHPRTRPISPALVDSIDMERSLAFYRDRFADAGDFTFVVVGNFAPDSIRPLVLTWLASLPARGRAETWRDVGIHPPEGVVRRVVRRGTEPKAQTQIIFSGPFTWDQESRYALASLGEVLRIRLRETLREDLGGTYGVSVSGSPSRWPRPEYQVAISFGSAPERTDSLAAAVFAVIDSMKRVGPTPEEVEKVREAQRRADETGLRENGHWLSALVFAERHGEDAGDILTTEEERATLSREMVREAARRWLDTTRYVQVTLLPEAAPADAAKP